MLDLETNELPKVIVKHSSAIENDIDFFLNLGEQLYKENRH